MYEKSDKRRIYYLLDMYLSGKINEPTLSDEFYYSYDLKLDRSTLNEEERNAFREIGEILGRFSEFEEDIKKYPGFFYIKDDVRQKVIETREKLKTYFEEYKKNDSDIDVNI